MISKKTVQAPANIAFIKYWGKTDPKTRVPANNSISMCLSEMYSVTTVEFNDSLTEDVIEFVDESVIKSEELERIVKTLNRVRERADLKTYAHVKTHNNFPKATGIASSASGFASLCMAALGAAGVTLSEKDLSLFSRVASGTATRSVPSGFVEWQKGTNSETSFGVSLYPPEYWDICDVVAVVTKKMKKVSSTEGHALAETSPFYQTRLTGMDEKIADIKNAMATKDFSKFGQILEAEALSMHAVCITSTPPVLYWEAPTMNIMRSIHEWRESEEVESYFTIDAGPTVHVVCKEKDAMNLKRLLNSVPGIEKVVINKPAVGARFIEEHLF